MQLLFGYNIMRARAQPNIASALPLYNSTTISSQSSSVGDLLADEKSASVYRQFLPMYL